MPRLVLEIPEAKAKEFQCFLSEHQRVDSFQTFGRHFLVNFICRSKEEYQALLQGIKEIFSPRNVRQLCRAKCINRTDCLNTAKYEDYCWRHKKEKKP